MFHEEQQAGEIVAGRYRLLRRLGAGEFADTYEVADDLRNDVAVLKRLRAPQMTESFRREHQLLATLSSIRLPTLRAVGTHDGAPYYVVDRIEGQPLTAPPADPWRVLGDITEALDCLHQHGVRHGDVSPQNILVTQEGGGVLIDLGAALPLEASTPQVGTPGFIAPELVRGAATDARADLYALGRVFAALEHSSDTPSLASIVAGLVAPFGERTPTARALLEQLGRQSSLAPVAGRAPELVGRQSELDALCADVDAFAEGTYDGQPVILSGPPGVGKTRLLRSLRLYAQRNASVATVEVPRLSAGWDGLAHAVGRRAGPDIEDWHQAANGGTPVVVFADDVPPSRLARFVRATPETARLFLIATSTHVTEGLGRAVALLPLTQRDLQRWAPALSDTDCARLYRATGGIPRDVEAALARVAAGEALFDSPTNLQTRPLPEGEALVATLVALCAGVPVAANAPLSELHRLGWVYMDEGQPRLRLRDAESIERALPERTRQAHRRAAETGHGAVRAYHLYRAGAFEAAEALAEGADFDADPEGWLRALRGQASAPLEARALRIAGRAEAALARLQDMEASPDVCRERALALLSLGRLEEAGRQGKRAAHAPTLARALVRQGKFDETLRIADVALAQADAHTLQEQAALYENRAAALVYLDRYEAAEGALDKADALAEGGARTQIRRALYRGIAHSRACAPSAAAAAYASALALAEAADVVDLRATAVLNLATAQQQLGDYGAALRGYERAYHLARAVDAGTTMGTSRYNLANLYLACGDARQGAVWLQEIEAQEPNGALQAAWKIAEGERHELLGEEDDARACYEEAASLGKRSGVQRKWVEAQHKLGAAAFEAACSLNASDLMARAWVLRANTLDGQEALAAIHEALELARASGDLPLLAEVMARAVEIARRIGALATAETWSLEARGLWEKVFLSLPRAVRGRFWSHPLRRQIQPQEPSRQAPANAGFRQILEINKRLNSSLPTKGLLEYALDAAIMLSRAERGFILLAGDRLRVSTARNMDRDQLRRPAMRFSRTIAERVLASREPVLTTNARADPRFDGTKSVHVMGLQSVACVPIESPRGVLGALYVDQRFLAGQFDEGTLELLVALADQVALALDAAQLRRALEDKATRLEQQSEERARLLARREAALSVSRSEVARLSAGEVRTDYAPLIGRSEAMRAVFAMLDRLAGTAVPVLIEGESGTGKELVARALHQHGGTAGPFLALNCAAVPAHLLESQLFGHRRGAFTGATESREGLFVSASGGTVFLDEIGELPLAMQGKLLRALQEREVQPVGADRVVPFDARIIAATNRNLREETGEGRFREDLYFRLAVVTLAVPALRDRLEDIPLLAEALRKQASEELGIPLRRFDEAAMRALLAHGWPGNVRELANVVRRALVMADGEVLRVEDLGLGAQPPSRPRSRAEFEKGETSRIHRALQDSDWNVSEAARRLSMPRNTLYRRMKKLGLR